MKRLLPIAMALTLVVPSLSHAEESKRSVVQVGLSGAAGYWFEGAAQFDANLRVQFNLGRVVSLGVRPGVLFNLPISGGFNVGLPVDAYIRFQVLILYFEVLGGLTVLFGNNQPFRANVAGGLGVVLFRHLSLGIEAGYTMYSPKVAFRVGFMF